MVMRSYGPAGTVGLALALLAAAALSTQDRPQPFRSRVTTVAVYATVKDAGGRLVPDLTQADFQILDDGKPASITTFSNEILPITAVLLIDTSFSVLPEYARIQASAHHFVESLLPADRLRIGSFGREVGLSPLLTSDKAVLTRVLDEEIWPGGGATPLWRATKMAMDSLATEAGRRVVVVLSDGHDSGGDYNCAPLVLDPKGAIGPCPGRGDVRKDALAGEFMYYAIGMERLGLEPGLVDLVDETGGGYFRLATNADLPATFERVAEELHRQYLLGFTPASLDGKTHKLELKVTGPGLSARATRSYVARPDR
jgi:VWFA-related protein